MPEYINCRPIMLPILDIFSMGGYNEVPLLYKEQGPDHKPEYAIGRNGITTQLLISKMGLRAQHLYLVSDEEIKEGNQFLDFGHKGTGPWKLHSDLPWFWNDLEQRKLCKKIVATTDKSLSLPLIPSSFIERWVNEHGKIDKVRILSHNGIPVTFNNSETEQHVVNILPIKDKLYSREEVKEIVAEAWIAKKVSHDHEYITFNEWFDKTYPI